MKQAEKMSLPVPKMEDNPLELDLDLMRAIQLSLDQQACSSSTPDSDRYSKHHRMSSSSSSASGEDDPVTENVQDIEDDETSLQRALELSYSNMVKGKERIHD